MQYCAAQGESEAAMKGLRHNVIEINDTENDNIDRILVFLKPQAEKVAITTTRAQATQLIKELDIRKVKSTKRRRIGVTAAAVGGIVILAVLALMLL